jgi:outer membrane protein OmpA-like peptidoglycan-associated protein
MLARVVIRRAGKHEGESPFWISFSDLMSALMVLFLVVMAVTLIAVTQSVRAGVERANDISRLMEMIAQDSRSKGVGVDIKNYRIDLGKQVRFDTGDYRITAGAGDFLRDYVPVLLRAWQTPEGQKWMRSIVVEGFTDQDGDYLPNLTLSLNRGKSVVCTLIENKGNSGTLSADQLRQVQELFLVGGYSFNSIKGDKADSRRVEFKLDFRSVAEAAENDANASSAVATLREQLRTKGFGSC